MIATLHRKHAPRVRKFAFFDVLDPGAIHPDRQVMLLLASDSASVTSNAFPIVDDEAVIHLWQGKYTVKQSM